MSWNQLQSLIDENRSDARVEANTPPTVCPIDGAALNVKADGVRDCPMGNFRWRG